MKSKKETIKEIAEILRNLRLFKTFSPREGAEEIYFQFIEPEKRKWLKDHQTIR